MFVSAKIKNAQGVNDVTVSTDNNKKAIAIPAKMDGKGSSVNGAELLFLALSTCFCNDIYREATKRKMAIISVEVTTSGEFGKEGEAGFNISYEVNVQSPSSQNEIDDLIRYVDSIAEIHKTVRQGTGITLKM